jgi:O-antigen/teichoic acid export membrane protein
MSREIATSIARNATVMMGSQVVTWVSTFILMVFLPRYLGSEEYGRLYLAMSVAMIAAVFVDFGGAYYISKEIARDRAQAGVIVSDSIGLRLGLSTLSVLVLFLFSWVAGYSWEVRGLILILGVAKLWEGPLGVLSATFQGFEQMAHRSVVAIVERVFLTIVGVCALLVGGSATTIAVIMAISTLLSCLVGFRRLRRLVPRLPGVQWRKMGDLVRSGVPYLLMAIFAVIYYRINAVMLSLQAPEAVVGWFGAAFRFFDILMFLPSILSMAVFPVLARTARESGTVSRTTVKSLEITLLAGVPLAVGTFAFADQIIAVLFGATGFAGSVGVLRALAPGLVLVYVDFVLVTALIAMDRQRQWSFVALAAIPVSVALNAVLIPFFQLRAGNGGIGSAIATNMTELCILVAALMLLPRDFFGRTANWQPAKTVVAGACMAGAIAGARALGIPWPVQALVGGLAYCVAVAATRALQPDEIAFVRRSMSIGGIRRLLVPQRSE